MDQTIVLEAAWDFMVTHLWEGLTVTAVFYFSFAFIGVRWLKTAFGDDK